MVDSSKATDALKILNELSKEELRQVESFLKNKLCATDELSSDNTKLTQQEIDFINHIFRTC